MLTILSIPQWDPQHSLKFRSIACSAYRSTHQSGILTSKPLEFWNHPWNFCPSAEFLIHSLYLPGFPSLSGTLISTLPEFLIILWIFIRLVNFRFIACVAYRSAHPWVGPSPQRSWIFLILDGIFIRMANFWAIAWIAYLSIQWDPHRNTPRIFDPPTEFLSVCGIVDP